MCDAIREEGRLAGIREAIAIVGSIGFGCESCIAEALARLSALLPPPSGGEKAEPKCNAVYWTGNRVCTSDDCPLHAPKPVAEKP
jgi:hypothetical protein